MSKQWEEMTQAEKMVRSDVKFIDRVHARERGSHGTQVPSQHLITGLESTACPIHLT
jgi:hypothetical protein